MPAESLPDRSEALLLPEPPLAGDVLAAKHLYERGQVELANGESAAAAVDFERSYAKSGNPKIFYELARARASRGEHARAYTLYAAYLAQVDVVSPARRAEVEGALREEEAASGHLAVVCDASMDVTIDDTLRLPCPFRGRVRVDRGRHHVVGHQPGCVAQKVVDGSPGSALVFVREPTR